MRIYPVTPVQVKSFTSTNQANNKVSQEKSEPAKASSGKAKSFFKTTGLALGGLTLAALAAYGIAYKASGTIPVKKIEALSKEIGTELADIVLNTGEKINTAQIREILTKKLGQKKAGKVIFGEDYKTFADFIKKELGLDDYFINYLYISQKSSVLAGPKSGKILLNLKINEMKQPELLNTVSHELEHVITRLSSPAAFNEKLEIKIRGKKFLNRYLEEYSEKVNEKLLSFQQSLLEMSNLGDSANHGFTEYPLTSEGLLKQISGDSRSSFGAMRDKIEDTLCSLGLDSSTKENKTIVKQMAAALKDEIRAYRAGGYTERYYTNKLAVKNNRPEEQNATKSEMLAKLYEEAIGVLKNIHKSATSGGGWFDGWNFSIWDALFYSWLLDDLF